MDKIKKIILINAVNKNLQKDQSMQALTVTPLALEIIRALTPKDWNVETYDENLKAFEDYENVDVVGISATTPNVNRAYEIAKKFRAHSKAIIMGGVHATAVPEEALRFVDSVVLGEVECVWSDILDDFENNALKETYNGKNGGKVPIACKPADIPVIDLSKSSRKYSLNSCETSRGCPYKCEFCQATRHFGYKYKMRPISDVIQEWKSSKKKLLFVVDDNMLGHSKEDLESRKRLLEAIIKSGVKKWWGTQASINIAEHEDLLALAHKAGLRQLYLGFESLNQEALKAMKKQANIKYLQGCSTPEDILEKYKKAIQIIHKHGIATIGGTIYGTDEDTPESLDFLSKFFKESDIDVIDFGILTPLPSTPLFERVKKEGRLLYDDFPRDWDYWQQDHLTIAPKSGTIEEFYLPYLEYLKKIKQIYKRHRGFWFTFRKTRNFLLALVFRSISKSYIKRAQNHINTINEELIKIKNKKVMVNG